MKAIWSKETKDAKIKINIKNVRTINFEIVGKQCFEKTRLTRIFVVSSRTNLIYGQNCVFYTSQFFKSKDKK